MSPQYIRHRINTRADLATVDPAHGVELDLRDRGERLIMVHDPFQDGEDFAPYLQDYRHGPMILNVKSERIEERVLEELEAAGTVREYFFLDCSFPMIRTLVKRGERNIAVRFSEYEPIEQALSLAGEVTWVWVDCFTKNPLTEESYGRLKEHFKLCAVSPELQGRGVESIADYAQGMAPFPMDAICSKRPDLWMQALGE
jgi:hypothetical protein